MDKNSVIAIVLSTLVLVGSFFVQTKFIQPKQAEKAQQQAVELEAKQKIQEEKIKADSEMVSASEDDADEVVEAAEYKIVTNKAEITFTNRGGDIVSYKLIGHKDKETDEGVEMALDVSSSNRAFALSIGEFGSPILNEYFKASVKDPYTILFHKDYEVKDENGNVSRYTIGKRYTFSPDDYAFKLDVSIVCRDGTDGLNRNGSSYTLRTSPNIGPRYDKKNRYEVRQYLALNGAKRIRRNIQEKTFDINQMKWAGVGGKYFTVLVKPENPESMNPYVKSVVKGDNSELCQVVLSRKNFEGKSINDTYYVYVGPRQESELIKYNDQTKNAWGLVNAKLNEALQTSGFLSPIEKILKWGLDKINIVAHNWGVSIIILTLILKIILFPLNKNTAIGSLKMQKLQPKMQEIQEKYKGDQQKIGIEMQKLYKANGYNPMSGCLPMVFQMVILFAMYNVFNNYFEFRGASFVKGWIDDLSVGDKILTWNTNIPFVTGFTMNTLRLLPFIYTASQLLNGKITQYGNAGAGGASQGQMKFMMYGMPLMFFFLFYNVPSGLLLYWTSSNILQIGQQLIINAYMKKQRANMNIKTVKKTANNKKK
ncbi:MAG: membrane protein insertase YidC [Treponema sp.]|nr:membrane protein insertase YidC [Treponema sp.]